MSEYSEEKLSEPLSLARAAELYGVSLSTLRRRAEKGELETLPRVNSRSPVMTTQRALEAAGFSRPVEVDTQLTTQLTTQLEEMITQRDRLTTQLEEMTTQLEAERVSRRAAELEAAEQRGRAEIALELRPMLEQAIDRLTTLQAEALQSSRPVLEVSSEQRSSQRRGLIDRLRGR
jgi:hypothetical protein